MKICSIKAQNYQTLQDVTINFNESFCAISGKNNAGKSCIIRLVMAILRIESRPWMIAEDFIDLDYKEDKTQWVSGDVPIIIECGIRVCKNDDPALISYISKMAELPQAGSGDINLLVCIELKVKEQPCISIHVNGTKVTDSTAKELLRKIKSSNLLFLHNSTSSPEEYYYGRRSGRAFVETVLSDDDKKELIDAEKKLKAKFKKIAKEHKESLSGLLGKLSDKYEVEFSTLESSWSRNFPLEITLNDKNVEVPLTDWGSGTKNRTHVLMSILQANRIKTKYKDEDRITPIVVIEEPESFLHPSAQAEFGKVIRLLATEYGIQTIVTTHSPYMLNQEQPESNILLKRDVRRGRLLGSQVVPTQGDKWMEPFAEHLGIMSEEFNGWKKLFGTNKQKVVLVEGSIDEGYFKHIIENNIIDCAFKDVEIVPYGGKDVLKNNLLIKFVLGKFDKLFITFDLDALGEVEKTLLSLGLRKGFDYLPVGLAQPGKDNIEGILPQRVSKAVMTNNPDIMMAMMSGKSEDRTKAKDEIKKLLLDEFRKAKDYTKDEMKEFIKMFKIIESKVNE